MFNLMALDSKVMLGRKEIPLAHFSPILSHSQRELICSFTKCSSVRTYRTLTFSLLLDLLALFRSSSILSAFPFTIVVPQLSHFFYWWPELMAWFQNRFLLGGCDAAGIILARPLYAWIHTSHLPLSYVGL